MTINTPAPSRLAEAKPFPTKARPVPRHQPTVHLNDQEQESKPLRGGLRGKIGRLFGGFDEAWRGTNAEIADGMIGRDSTVRTGSEFWDDITNASYESRVVVAGFDGDPEYVQYKRDMKAYKAAKREEKKKKREQARLERRNRK